MRPTIVHAPRPSSDVEDRAAIDRSVLEDATLVLNRSWMVVNVTTVRRAITLLYLDLARAIQPETFATHDFASWMSLEVGRDDPHVRGVSFRMRVPEVVVLVDFDERPALRVPFSRRNLFLRDEHRCQYCGVRGPTGELSIDHVVPRSRGGTSTWTNCVLACHACNVRKGSRTPNEAGMRLMRRPLRPRWSPYLSLHLSRGRRSWDRFLQNQTRELEWEL